MTIDINKIDLDLDWSRKAQIKFTKIKNLGSTDPQIRTWIVYKALLMH